MYVYIYTYIYIYNVYIYCVYVYIVYTYIWFSRVSCLSNVFSSSNTSLLQKSTMKETLLSDVYSSSNTSTHYLRMGWLRLLGPLKLKVSFAKDPYKRDAII